ncbi:hypothetical protein B4U80_11876 [Leptotrombidium deliense]|uniref:F-box domain-containing protein n=1 Tax=Leptotrombidium deliense TaxID=299467 RepID=A0A443S1H1_9ACAR|nr:hypothetical protein B4U80_11876 [Leptotrombidium deliense]
MDLPTNVWSKVLGHLPVKERLRVARVSKTWNSLVIFDDKRILCTDEQLEDDFPELKIRFPGFKICLISAWIHFLGVIKKHRKMTHLKMVRVAFQEAASDEEMENIANEIQAREIGERVPIEHLSFDNSIDVFHFDQINNFTHLRQFVWDRSWNFELIADSVNQMLQANANTLRHLSVTSDMLNDLEIDIVAQLESVIFKTIADTNRQPFWQSLINNCGITLTKLVATLFTNNEMLNVNHFDNVTDLRLELNPVPYNFTFSAQHLRVLTLLYANEPVPSFNRVLHLFQNTHNHHLEILDVDLPVTETQWLQEICMSSPNLRLLKLRIGYGMDHDSGVAIMRLTRLQQLDLNFVEEGEMQEWLLSGILNPDFLPNLRVISVPQEFGNDAYNALVTKANLSPNELFYFEFNLDGDAFPQHERIKMIDRDIHHRYFRWNDVANNEYFVWQRIRPQFFH